MKRKHKRLTFIVIALCLFSTAAGLILMALEDNIIFFYSPTDLIEKNPDPKQRLRLGGLVAEKSLKKLTLKDLDLLFINQQEIFQLK